MRASLALSATLALAVSGCAGSTILGMFSTQERPQIEADPGMVLWTAVRVFESTGIPVAEEEPGWEIRSERIRVRDRWGGDRVRDRITCVGGDEVVTGRSFDVHLTARVRRLRPGLSELYIVDSVEPVVPEGEDRPPVSRCSLDPDFRSWLVREVVRQTG